MLNEARQCLIPVYTSRLSIFCVGVRVSDFVLNVALPLLKLRLSNSYINQMPAKAWLLLPNAR